MRPQYTRESQQATANQIAGVASFISNCPVQVFENSSPENLPYVPFHSPHELINYMTTQIERYRRAPDFKTLNLLSERSAATLTTFLQSIRGNGVLSESSENLCRLLLGERGDFFPFGRSTGVIDSNGMSFFNIYAYNGHAKVVEMVTVVQSDKECSIFSNPIPQLSFVEFLNTFCTGQ